MWILHYFFLYEYSNKTLLSSEFYYHLRSYGRRFRSFVIQSNRVFILLDGRLDWGGGWSLLVKNCGNFAVRADNFFFLFFPGDFICSSFRRYIYPPTPASGHVRKRVGALLKTVGDGGGGLVK